MPTDPVTVACRAIDLWLCCPVPYRAWIAGLRREISVAYNVLKMKTTLNRWLTGIFRKGELPDDARLESNIMSSQKMIVGLGNPGPEYQHNRHNIGFQCVDLLAARHRIDFSRMQKKARTADGWIQKHASPLDTLSGGIPQVQRVKVLLVKPMTYMNLSGNAVGALVRYYDIDPDDMIVIHDDLDLEPGQLRLRRNGGSGGQNGIKSIIADLDTQDFHRVRVGIGRPPGRMRAADYVLQNFRQDEEADIIAPTRHRVVDALECWLFDGIDTAMNRYNG